MKDDDKTVEILVPVPPLKTPVTVDIRQIHSETLAAKLPKSSPLHESRQTYSTVAIRRSWIDGIKQEVCDDWTLRLLAVLTVLVLSLLVL